MRDDTPVKADTKATLEMQGLTGGIYVLLNEGTQTAADLPKTMKAPYPEIGSRRSALAQIFQGAPELIAKGSLLLDKATLLFDEENRTAIKKILSNVESLTGDAEFAVRRVGKTSDGCDHGGRKYRRHEPGVRRAGKGFAD